MGAEDPDAADEGSDAGSGMTDPEALVRAYYAALDEHAPDELAELLAPGFVHDRPDRTIDGRDAFVAFMRDGRPLTDTTHEIERLIAGADAVAVQGRLLDADGDELFRFADVHAVEGGAIAHLRTYVHGPIPPSATGDEDDANSN